MSSMKRGGIATIVGISLIGLALAQDAKKQAEQFRELFLELDANHDGAIERDEVPASGRPAFERLLKRGDDNGNGRLEAEEYRSILQDLRSFGEQAKKKAIDRFKAMDKDGDGRISRDEFTGPRPRFDILDRNGDGFLTQQELVAAAQGKAAAKTTAKKKRESARKEAEKAP
jgi:Ca2+-binding EF-hand superfamily protein